MPTSTILITGASSGIGEATAKALAAAGHHVIATARRVEPLEALARQHSTITAVSMDVTDPESIARVVAEAGPIDVVVNNAGIGVTGPVETMDRDQVRRQFDVNVFGLLDVTRAVLPQMRERRRGRVINIGSLVGRTTFPGIGAYCATKYAVESLSDSMRMELSPYGIDVALIEPGFINTAFSESPSVDPELADGAYRDFVTTGAAYLEREIGKGADPAALAQLVVDVVAAKRPRTRYLFPAQTRVLLALLDRLPDRAADKLKRKTMGLGRS